MRALAIDPANTDTLYIGTSGRISRQANARRVGSDHRGGLHLK
jgi:hypothetical protein